MTMTGRLGGLATSSLLASVLAFGSPAGAQTERDFTVLRDWAPGESGGRTEARLDALRLKSGSITSPRVYADFILRFEYRIATVDDAAELMLRTGGFPRDGLYSYVVALNAGAARGKASGWRTRLHESGFTPPAAPTTPGSWIPCEVRVDGGRLTTSVDRVVVSTADGLDEPFGTIGFRVKHGAIELRALRIAEIVPSPVIPADLPRVDAPGISMPTLTHREQPHYSLAAMRARAQGVALLEFVLGADGSIGAVRVKKAPHLDLAVAAVACLRRWRFEPARRNGQPIAVVATAEVAFRLK